MTIVVADLGATNARFAVLKKGRLSDIYQYACDDFNNPKYMIQSFIHLYAPEAKYFLAGVPGPVLDGKVKWTNRSWKLEAKKLKSDLKLKEVVLMNDLQVQGVALAYLKKTDLVYLRHPKSTKGPKVLVNVGTGLGSCYIIDNNVFSSEYGQTLSKEGCTLETDISGTGFKRLYQKLAKNKAPISAVKIAEQYLKKDALSKKTYTIFYNDLAQVLINMALTIKATGGVYFCGGVLDEKTLKQMKFADSFITHPKMNSLLKKIPLIFIRRKDFAFLGLKKLAKKYDWS